MKQNEKKKNYLNLGWKKKHESIVNKHKKEDKEGRSKTD